MRKLWIIPLMLVILLTGLGARSRYSSIWKKAQGGISYARGNVTISSGTLTVSGALTVEGSEFNEKSVFLLGTATLNVQSTGQTTIYTVPTGKRCLLNHIKIVSGATASPTAIVSFGQSGAATDFVGNQTMTKLAAQYDFVIIMPVPNSTPVKTKSYAATTVIQADVTTADVDGGTDNAVYVYGTLY